MRNALSTDTILLLSEVEEMIDAATDIIVQPCDCRRPDQNCDRPVETCIWLDEGAREALDRRYGRRLSKEEARELVRWPDKQGLMHTADGERCTFYGTFVKRCHFGAFYHDGSTKEMHG